ncbi:sensor histidine kinase [uncultured Lacinutrix sp.]|uniref:sensor histidine kinase n=1 Tax=uncultured Lacinutrix sp. TaxID=574032 RepID=UPI00262DC7A4|nr:histidine kinase [uncultured Lacinutrix sp.]
MIAWIYKNKKLLLVIGGISILIPLFYISYVVITTEEDSTTISINANSILVYTIIAYYILITVLIIFYGVHWFFKQIKQVINLKNEKAKTELKHLKSQVNPHFFFNMLNNLYGLVDTNSVKAKQLILKLSDMMRYSIYEGQNDKVSIQEEIDFISNYIELHEMRYHKHIEVSFHRDIDNNKVKVMPLLFIILVENAFKHGVEVLREDAYVRMKIKANRENVFFEIENNFDSTHKTEKGIGLKNLKRRLELVYPKQNSLSTKTQNEIFKATLEIQL